MEYQFCHGKARSLPSTQYCDLLVDILALEEKCTENIPESCPDIPDCYLIQSIKDSIFLLQYILLILCIISQINIIAHLGLTTQRLKFSGNEFHHCTLSLTVPSYKSHLLTSLNSEFWFLKDHLFSTILSVRITCHQICSLKNDLTGSGRRRELEVQSRIILTVDLYSFNLFQSLDT